MTKFQPASIRQGEADRITNELYQKCITDEEARKEIFGDSQPPIDEIEGYVKAFVAESLKGDVYVNDEYQVIVRQADVRTDWPPMIHLSIKRLDGQPARDWRHLQQIKNELVSNFAEGVELFPSDSRLVDTANQTHLWVLTDELQQFPFGFDGRCVTSKQLITNTNQRPFEEQKSATAQR